MDTKMFAHCPYSWDSPKGGPLTLGNLSLIHGQASGVPGPPAPRHRLRGAGGWGQSTCAISVTVLIFGPSQSQKCQQSHGFCDWKLPSS